ncbi:MAG: Dabb family protein, partial [Bacteroidaceae bacterium]|nr:Dabb family protein [Bacteroidaceae bacterium]
MVKHIVLFKLKNELSAETRTEVMNSFKQGIENLVGRIEEIRSIEVGFNCNA